MASRRTSTLVARLRERHHARALERAVLLHTAPSLHLDPRMAEWHDFRML